MTLHDVVSILRDDGVVSSRIISNELLFVVKLVLDRILFLVLRILSDRMNNNGVLVCGGIILSWLLLLLLLLLLLVWLLWFGVVALRCSLDKFIFVRIII